MALARKHRLPKKDISRVFNQGKTVKNSFFFIKFLKNETKHLRLAVIVPSKVLKKATARNHVKRIFTETFRSGQFLKKSFDVAIVATVNIVEKQSKEIKRELEQTLNKIFGQSR